jgi:hypothetical protein
VHAARHGSGDRTSSGGCLGDRSNRQETLFVAGKCGTRDLPAAAANGRAQPCGGGGQQLVRGSVLLGTGKQIGETGWPGRQDRARERYRRVGHIGTGSQVNGRRGSNS